MFNRNIVLLSNPELHPASKRSLSVGELNKAAFISLVQRAKGVRTLGTSFKAVKVLICKEVNLS